MTFVYEMHISKNRIVKQNEKPEIPAKKQNTNKETPQAINSIYVSINYFIKINSIIPFRHEKQINIRTVI